MEVLERNLRDERCLCWRMKEEEEKKNCKWGPRSRARLCQLSGVLLALAWQGQASTGTDRAKVLAFLCSIFCRFLESWSDNYLERNLKQRKTNKIKAIKCVGCLPRSTRLESLA